MQAAPTDGSGDIAQPSNAAPDRTERYRAADGTELELHVFEPAGPRASTPRPGIVFFHGGAWRKGSPAQFFWQARRLAERGMVAFSAQYRLVQDESTPPGVPTCAAVPDCLADARAALAHVRVQAERYGIDPGRLAAGGGSAGGHLAAACAVHGDPVPAESRPDLLVLFNPALFHRLAEATLTLEDFTAATPPGIVFYGDRDEMVTYGRDLHAHAQAHGNDLELHLAPGEGHGFFNRSPWRDRTFELADRFLARHGYLQGESSVPVDASAVLHKV